MSDINFDMSLVSGNYTKYIFIFNGYIKNNESIINATDEEIGFLIYLATYTVNQPTRCIVTPNRTILKSKDDLIENFKGLFDFYDLSRLYDKSIANNWILINNGRLCVSKDLILYHPNLNDVSDLLYTKIYVKAFQEAVGIYSYIAPAQRLKQLALLGKLIRCLWQCKPNKEGCLVLKQDKINYLRQDNTYIHTTKRPEQPTQKYYISKITTTNSLILSPHIFFKGSDNAFKPVNRLKAMEYYDNY